jgi:hypothetical protein
MTPQADDSHGPILCRSWEQAGKEIMNAQLGYYYHPSIYSPPLGHPQLEVNISRLPTDRFFDTKRARFHVAEGGTVRLLSVSYPWQAWQGPDRYTVCAGRFYLSAHDGSVIEGFSLGGHLEIEVHDDVTTCHLTSPAPIFSLPADPDSPVVIVVSELEDLVAERHAAWGTDDAGFSRRLVQADPFLLSVAGLLALKQRFDQVPTAARSQMSRKAARMVEQAIRTLEKTDAWPASVPALADLL